MSILQQNHSEIVSNIINSLHEQNIIEGILVDVIQNELVVNREACYCKRSRTRSRKRCNYKIL